jgi:transposase
MSKANFSDDFKRDAVHQIVGRRYSVAEVSRRLRVSTHSLYAWVKKFSKPAASGPDDEQAAEIRRLKRELLRVTEERDILKKATAYFAQDLQKGDVR